MFFIPKQLVSIVGASVLMVSVHSGFVWGEVGTNGSESKFVSTQGEVLEIEDLRNPTDAAIYKVKDFSTGKVVDFFVDFHRVAVKMNGEARPTKEVYPGAKAFIIYRESSDQGKPEIVFMKVVNPVAI